MTHMTGQEIEEERAVFADYLEEREMQCAPPLRLSLRTALDSVNGKRRTRTIDAEEVIRCAGRLESHGDVRLLMGGWVANAYRYRASQTSVLVYRFSHWTLAWPRLSNAKKGCTGFGDIVRGNRWDSSVKWVGGAMNAELIIPHSVLVLEKP